MRKRGEPGAQGVTVTGIQGMGVRAPRAADVAEATVGLAIELHIPKGRMLTKGTKSMMLAAGVGTMSRFCGRTVRALGAAPKLHCVVAPIHTRKGIILTSLDYSAKSKWADIMTIFKTSSSSSINHVPTLSEPNQISVLPWLTNIRHKSICQIAYRLLRSKQKL